MTGKIMKYEFKSVIRSYVLLWILLLAAAVFVRSRGHFMYSYIKAGSGLYFLFFLCVVLLSLLVPIVKIVSRMVYSLFGRGGLQTRMLPVSSGKLLRAKILAQSLLLFLHEVVLVLACAVVMSGFFSGTSFDSLYRYYGLHTVGVIFQIPLILTILLIPAKVVTGITAVLSLGQYFRKHPVIGSLVVYGILQLLLDVGASLLNLGLSSVLYFVPDLLVAGIAEFLVALLVIFFGFFLSSQRLKKHPELFWI